MKFTKLFLVFILTLESAVAFAQAPRCEHVFFPTVFEVLLETNQQNKNFLFNEKDFPEFMKNYSWLQRRKIRKVLQSVEVQNFTSAAAIERYAAELTAILFGSRLTVDRWLLQSKSERLEESTVLLIKEQLLQEGLLKTWQDQHDPRTVGLLRKSLDFLGSMPKTKWAILHLPWSLPERRDQRISPDLMSVIIRDGFKIHANAVRDALGSQDHVEAYNTFRKLYGVVFFTSVVGMHILTAYQMMEWEQQLLAEEALRDLRKTQEGIRNLELLKESKIESAYQESLKIFKDRWGENPTPAEAQALRLKIEALVSASE